MGRWHRLVQSLRMREGMPFDVLPASNGEFDPGEPTREQLLIMALQDREAERVRRRLGLPRRDFVRSAAAYGVGLWAIGQVRPFEFGGYRTDGPLQGPGTEACDLEWPGAQLNNLPGEFIFDVQSHHIESGGDWRVTNPGFHAFFAAVWEQSGPLGGAPQVNPDGSIRGWGEGGEYDPIENLSRYHYLKELYLDSSTNMTVLSAVPSAPNQQPLPVDEAALTAETVNRLASGTPRCVMHAFSMPNRGSAGMTGGALGREPLFMQEEFDLMERHAKTYPDRLRGWKIYTPWGDVPNSSGWFLDDDIGMAFVDQVRYVAARYGGPTVVAAHKGFALPAFDQRAASPRDIGPSARQNRDVAFIVYHSGYDGEEQTAYPGDDNVNSADRGVDCLVKSLRENGWDASRFVPRGLEHGNVPNVYAEIGATMRSVVHDPNQLAHLLGKLIAHVGPQRVVWGTDSLWFGSPQSEIVALRGFTFSDRAKELYNLPYGLDGDRFDPRRDALDASSYRSPHPAVPGWPADGRAHPERTIRNGIFGRNAAIPYGVEPDTARKAIDCDDVQKIRDAYILNPATPRDPVSPREIAPGAANEIHGPRTRRELWAGIWPNAPWAP